MSPAPIPPFHIDKQLRLSIVCSSAFPSSLSASIRPILSLHLVACAAHEHEEPRATTTAIPRGSSFVPAACQGHSLCLSFLPAFCLRQPPVPPAPSNGTSRSTTPRRSSAGAQQTPTRASSQMSLPGAAILRRAPWARLARI